MLDKKTVEKRLENSRITLKNLEGKTEKRITISKKLLTGYCNETIMLCEILLILLQKKEIADVLNPVCFGKYEKEKNACFQCVWRSPCLEKISS